MIDILLSQPMKELNLSEVTFYIFRKGTGKGKGGRVILSEN